MAHGVLQHMVEEQSLQDLISRVDSCGTGAYHEGSQPDPRTLSTLAGHAIKFKHEARQLSVQDFDDFDYILAMDRSNLANIKSMRPKGEIRAKVHLFGDFGPRSLDSVVKDPYYDSGNQGFEKAYQQCQEFSKGLIRSLQNQCCDK